MWYFLASFFALFQISAVQGTTSKSSAPFFEADYQALVEDLPTLSLGPDSGYSPYRKTYLFGPNCFPVATDNDGFAYIAAGRIYDGKFLVVPQLDKYLEGDFPQSCIYDWKYKDQPQQGCANPSNSKTNWCATGLDSNGNYVSGSGKWKWCKDPSTLPKYPHGAKLIKNAMKWMSNGKEGPIAMTDVEWMDKAIANYTTDLESALNPETTDVFFAGNYGSWNKENVELLKNYLLSGGNVIFISRDSYLVSGNRVPIRSLMLFLGIWDGGEVSQVNKDFDTSKVPLAENILTEELKRAIDGNLPEEIDRKSLGKKVLYDFYSSTLSHNDVVDGSYLVQSPFYSVLEQAYLGILNDYEKRDEHFPDFVPFFQAYILPSALQNPEFNPELIRTAPTPFPPKFKTNNTVKRTVKVDWKYKKPETCWDKNCHWSWFTTNFVSTKLYAVPGELVKVTIPSSMAGKVTLEINLHRDNNIIRRNKLKWDVGTSPYYIRPGTIYSLYDTGKIGSNITEITMMSPYGGSIVVYLSKDANFELTVEGAVDIPYFIQGKTTNEEFKEMMDASDSPMVELEIPGSMIFTIPVTTVNAVITDMELLANKWKEIMDAIQWMVGYKYPRPERYVTDTNIMLGDAHSGYPMMEHPLATYLFDVDYLDSGAAWGVFHEIGHNLQDPRWTPGGTGEVTNNIFATMVNNKVLGKDYTNFFAQGVDKFRNSEKKFSNLKGDVWLFLRSYQGPHLDFGWEPYAKTFAAYLEMPTSLSPNTNENKHSTWARLMSNFTGHNLVPYFQWWDWPINDETIEATKDLPLWDMATKLETLTYSCDGGDDCCTVHHLCGPSEGDCDFDEDCNEGLRCGVDNCPATKTFAQTDDCCYKHETCSGTDSGYGSGYDCCTPKYKCGENEGDCDKDEDCKEGYKCGTDNCPQGLPNSLPDWTDCCYKP